MRRDRWRAHGLALAGVALMLLIAGIGAQEAAARSGQFAVRETRVSKEIVAPALVCQTFTAEYPGLYAVRVMMATYGRGNAGTLVFHLRTAPDARGDLATLFVDIPDLADNAFHDFEFPPIRDSEQLPLSFCLEVPVGEKDDTVGAWGTRSDDYDGGQAVFRGIEANDISDLVFEVDYRFVLPGTYGAVTRQLARNKPALWGESWFYGGLGVGYLALLYVLLARVALLGPDDAARRVDGQEP